MTYDALKALHPKSCAKHESEVNQSFTFNESKLVQFIKIA